MLRVVLQWNIEIEYLDWFQPFWDFHAPTLPLVNCTRTRKTSENTSIVARKISPVS